MISFISLVSSFLYSFTGNKAITTEKNSVKNVDVALLFISLFILFNEDIVFRLFDEFSSNS